MDTEDVARGTEIWDRIESSIRQADFVVALIGPGWRPELLANEDDWVRRELLLAHRVGCPVLPTFHSGANPKRLMDKMPEDFEFIKGVLGLKIPDPPDHLAEFDTGLREFVDERLGQQLPGKRRLLEGVRVGLSTSEPDDPETARDLGLVRYSILYLTEKLLEMGASLTYGGLPPTNDRTESWNVTNQLRVLAGEFGDQIENYVPDSSLSSHGRRIGGVLHIGHKPRVSTSGFSPSAARAIELHDFRVALSERTDIRICLGGRSAGYAGRMPGVVEEVAVSLARQQPVFLLGGGSEVRPQRWLGSLTAMSRRCSRWTII